MLPSLALLLPLLLAGGERTPVGYVVDVEGKGLATIKSGDVTRDARDKEKAGLLVGDTITAGEARLLLFFGPPVGNRQYLKANKSVTVTDRGFDPADNLEPLPVPPQYPPKPKPGGPPFKSNQRSAGVSFVLNTLDKNTRDQFTAALDAGALKSEIDVAYGEIYYQIADRQKLERTWTTHPKFSKETREALFQHGYLNPKEDVFRWLLDQQPAEEKVAHSYAAYLAAEALVHQGKTEEAKELFKKAETMTKAIVKEDKTAAINPLLVTPQWLPNTPNPTYKPTFGTLKLDVGFTPDPTVIKLLAGGKLRTGLGGVGAWVAEEPDVRLNYKSGIGQIPLSFYVESEADTTLLINMPDGSWRAIDDGKGTGLNPLIVIRNPPSGQYDIWVGTYRSITEVGTPPAQLFISELKRAD